MSSHQTTNRQQEINSRGFRDGDIDDVILSPLDQYSDERGWLVELYREDEVPAAYHPVMAYMSQTEPGVARGPHEHRDQTDLFAFLGPGDFQLFLWDARPDSATFCSKLRIRVGASNPTSVVVPPGVVHAYQNVSDTPGVVLNLPNRLFRGVGKAEAVDEIRHENDPESPYKLD